MIYKSGAVYDGDWIENRKFGQGSYYYPQSNDYAIKYEGTIQNGNYSGLGSLHYKNGDIYKGQWEDNKKCGYGVIVYSEGDKIRDRYEGYYSDDLRHGNGRIL